MSNMKLSLTNGSFYVTSTYKVTEGLAPSDPSLSQDNIAVIAKGEDITGTLKLVSILERIGWIFPRI